MTRFTTDNPAAAAEAVAALPGDVHELAARIEAATRPLRELPDTITAPADALNALVAWRRHQDRIRRAEDAVLLRLHASGASPRGLGNALNINRETVARRVAAARAERDQV